MNPEPETRKSEPGTRNPELRVLLIEDNPGDVRLIREILAEVKGVPIALECVDRLETGLERLAAGGIDGVLLDLGLPDSQGFETFARAYAQAPAVPIMVLTGLDDEALGVRAVREGAQDYLVKGQVDGRLLIRSLRYSIERKLAEEALERLRRQKDLILNSAGEGIYGLDLEGNTTFANPAAARMIGWEVADLIGKPQHAVLHHSKPDGTRYPREECPIYAAFNDGTVHQMDSEVFWRKDGTSFPVEYTSTPIWEDGTLAGAVVTFRDITERKQAEAERARNAAKLQELAGASLVLNTTLSLDEVLKIVTEKARELIGAHQSVTSMTVDENWAQAITNVSLSDKYAAYREYDEKPDGSGIYWLVCQMNRPMRMTQAELEAHPAWRGFGKEAGKHPPMRGWLAAPLSGHDGRDIGLIQLSDKYEGEFTDDDYAILVQLAQMASVAVENARLFEQVSVGRERLQTFSHRLVQVQDAEQRHIAGELHDEIGQLLTGLKLVLERTTRSSADAVRASLGEALALVNELMSRVRELSLNLRPAMLDDLGLLPALLWQVERYTAQTNVHVDFKHDGVEERFASEVETATYRIVQESLTNVARHAGVGEVAVRLWVDQETLSVQIEDQGKGFDPGVVWTAGVSSGLTGMQERATTLGGRLTVESAPGTGTRIAAELPLGGAERQRKDPA